MNEQTMRTKPVLFADLLRHKRTTSGLTQEELAERAGLSVRAISSLERGINRAPRKDTLEMLLHALDVPPDERRQWERARQHGNVRNRTRAAIVESEDRVRSNRLPSPLSSMVGREREVVEVGNLLKSHRLVTLVGPGGIGKTRVAIAAGHRLLAEYEDGIALVDLTLARDVTQVLSTIAVELGVHSSGSQPVKDALASMLKGRKFLVILDNFEHVIEAAPDISWLLTLCPFLAVLATSREPLRVTGEVEYPIAPLPVPSKSHGDSIEQLRRNPSIALFVERARLVNPGIDLTARTRDDIVSICQQLDGMPLALELAAARLRSLSLSQVRGRLEQPLTLLTSGARDLPDRQRAMRDTIQWSYDLLSPPEQMLFRRLSVFVGGWTLATAEAVTNGDGIFGAEFQDSLASLVEKSLAVQIEQTEAVTRFRMLEPIREFGVELLESHDDADFVHISHATAFLQLARDAEQELLSGLREVWLSTLDKEYANLRAAMQWLLVTDVVAALDLAGTLGWFWYIRGKFTDGRSALVAVLASDAPPGRVRAKALTSLARITFYQEEYDEARKHARSSIEMWRETGDQHGLAHALIVASLTDLVTGRTGRLQAIEQLHEANHLFESLDDEWGVAQALLYLAVADTGVVAENYLATGEARQHLERSAEIYRSLGDQWQLGIVLSYLALVAEYDEDVSTALLLHQESYQLSQEVGDKWRIRLTGNRLASLLHRNGDFSEAIRTFKEVLQVSRDLGVEEFQAFEQEQLGRVLVDCGKTREAITYLQDALRTYRGLDEREDLAVILHTLGDAVASQNDTTSALAKYRESLAMAGETGQVEVVLNCLYGVALLLEQEGGPDQAVQLMSVAARERESHKLELAMHYRKGNTATLRRLRLAAGDNRFNRAWEAGLVTPLHDAIERVRRLSSDAGSHNRLSDH